MSSLIRKPVTYLQGPSPGELHKLLQQLFRQPEPEQIPDVVTGFLRSHSLAMNDFPRVEGTYSRTILYRNENGYEAMAARWNKGVLTSIHGHPFFVFYYVIEGKLKIDNYTRTEKGLAADKTMVFTSGQGFHAIGVQGRFDNSIHQVRADEETLSLHIFSGDGTRGEVFDSREVLPRQAHDSPHSYFQISAG